MSALFLIFLAMAIKDIFGALWSTLLRDHRSWLAGAADGTSDILAFGFVGINIYDHAHRTTAWVVLAFALLWLGSVLGTVIGNAVEEYLEKRRQSHA